MGILLHSEVLDEMLKAAGNLICTVCLDNKTIIRDMHLNVHVFVKWATYRDAIDTSFLYQIVYGK